MEKSEASLLKTREKAVPTTRIQVPSESLPPGGRTLVRAAGKQIALFRLASGEVRAIDNACPHEGYPLIKGVLKDCVLTCSWHNFKFDLTNGACIMGDEDVRIYPVTETGNQLVVEIVEPNPEEEIPRYVASLNKGLNEGRMGQVARDTVRLLKLGMEPAEVALVAARYDADYAEFGTTHALPVAVDMMRYFHRYPELEAVTLLMQPMDLCADAHVRRQKRPVPSPVDPGTNPEKAGDRLFEWVEQEETEQAEALLRGAIQKGWDREIIEGWLYRCCAQHFLGFGHALIYLRKAFDLLEVVGWSHAIEVLPALLLSIINQTREEVLPEWNWFRSRLEDVEPRFETLYPKPGDGEDIDVGLLSSVFADGKREEAFDAVTDALERGAPLSKIVDAMVIAASERILRFDVQIDTDRTLQHSWIDVTHLLTYSNALRHAVKRYPCPKVLRLIYFGARFINNFQPLDMEPDRQYRFGARVQGSAELCLERLKESIAIRDAPLALDAFSTFVLDGGDPGILEDYFADLVLADTLTRPIVVAHLIKTSVAAFEEYGILAKNGYSQATLPIQAIIRLSASPIKERFISRRSYEAIRFIEHGKVPKTLA